MGGGLNAFVLVAVSAIHQCFPSIIHQGSMNHWASWDHFLKFIIECLRLHLSTHARALSRDVSFYTRVGWGDKVSRSVSVLHFNKK